MWVLGITYIKKIVLDFQTVEKNIFTSEIETFKNSVFSERRLMYVTYAVISIKRYLVDG